ncbi:hypothetical protein SNEBB_010866 [Seison nebaliae]|nr:hypothetical protein SNEBB_010866 [Seison nebaliae]
MSYPNKPKVNFPIHDESYKDYIQLSFILFVVFGGILITGYPYWKELVKGLIRERFYLCCDMEEDQEAILDAANKSRLRGNGVQYNLDDYRKIMKLAGGYRTLNDAEIIAAAAFAKSLLVHSQSETENVQTSSFIPHYMKDQLYERNPLLILHGVNQTHHLLQQTRFVGTGKTVTEL